MFDITTANVLDSNDLETLYSVSVTELDDEVSVLVGEDGVEYVTNDMQGTQPKTIDECVEFDWYAPELVYAN